MSNSMGNSILRFVVLILAQVAIFNHINFAGYINPYPYILFILLYPITENKAAFLLFSFLLGLTLDMFMDSGGMHAAACLIIAHLRHWVLGWVFGVAYEYNAVNVAQTTLGQRAIYFSILVFTHQLILFSLETFNVSDIIYILKKTLFCGVFTLVLCLILTSLFSYRRR